MHNLKEPKTITVARRTGILKTSKQKLIEKTRKLLRLSSN